MISLTDRNQCCGCSACADSCPHGAIRMQADGMGFKYPVVDEDKCVDCGICEKICAFHPIQKQETPKCEAIRFPDLLSASQSGGLGFAIMHKAILEGYVVYGAAIADDLSVRHIRVTDEDGLAPLRLSKYVQSDMTGIPAKVLEDLEAGSKVLFTGTPCQCAGVASIAGKYRNRLLLVDIICHGVPSPAVWKSYLEEKSKGRKLTGALFRDPALGWHDHRETLIFEDGKEVSDEYTFLFYRHLMLRPSCHICPFASLSRPSDITMADFWGVEKDIPGFADDNLGCSLLLTHTEAGAAFCREFPDECVRTTAPIPTDKQPNLYAPSKPGKHAESFENVYIRRGYSAAARRFGRQSLPVRMERFIKKVKRHI